VRSYRQYCAAAKALDVIGDRWTLLIVRELLIGGPARYTDLLHGLPGIATNLLANRLRELDHAGIVQAESAPPPVATTLFTLTPRGRELEPVLHALGRWGGPLLGEQAEDDAFQTRWLTLPLRLYLRDQAPDGPPVTIELRTGNEPLLIEVKDGTVMIRPGRAENPDAILTGTPAIVIPVLTGALPLGKARARGLTYKGDPALLKRLQPPKESASVDTAHNG
jgi:DNA-binding HxlR family transcriptional regulator